MKIINLELTLDEVNVIMDALSLKQYKDVFQIIPKIHEQAMKQVNEEQSVPATNGKSSKRELEAASV